MYAINSVHIPGRIPGGIHSGSFKFYSRNHTAQLNIPDVSPA